MLFQAPKSRTRGPKTEDEIDEEEALPAPRPYDPNGEAAVPDFDHYIPAGGYEYQGPDE